MGARRARRFLFLILTAVLVLQKPISQPQLALAQPPNLLVYPYLGETTATSVVISWATDSTGASEVRYSLGQSYSNVVAATDSTYDGKYWHSATVTGLAADTPYYYKVYTGGDDVTPWSEITFTTAPEATAPGFTFVALGDSRPDSTSSPPSQGALDVAAEMDQHSFDLALHTGDIICDGGSCSGDDSAWNQYIRAYFDVYQESMGDIPFYPSIGNHELGDCGYQSYTDVYNLPGNGPSGHEEEYYSFDWGIAHFVALDTNQSYSAGSTQYDWLVNDLQTSTQPWKFVFFHHPAYSSGDHGSTSEVQTHLVPIFETYGVDVVFNGHDHHYERTCPILSDICTTPQEGGVVYYVTGGGGAPLYPAFADWFTAYSESLYHFLEVEVNDCWLRVDAIDTNGSVFDSYEINYCSANAPPVVGDIPGQTIEEGEAFLAINLDDYVSDVDNSDEEMTWTYAGNVELTVSIVDRVATIGIPNADWNGSEMITFTATDPGGESDSDGAIFTVTPTVIDIWYGSDQPFGQNGIPQPWVNVLGNVSDPDGVASLVYSLNGGPESTLSIGPDGRRLESAGDFNIDMAYTDLVNGPNQVLITATDGLGGQSTEMVTVTYSSGNVWPLPYLIDWSSVSSIQDVAHVVDGKWTLGGDSVRTEEPGYDRLVAIGDVEWTDYEVMVPVTIHDVSGNGGAGVLLRWNGHTDDPISGWQPKSGWNPLGCIGWFRPNRLEFWGNGDDIIATDYSRTPVAGVTYIFKMRVETIPGEGGLYSLKVWEDGQSEPSEWDLTAQEKLSDPQNGSMTLIAYLWDVSFGDVTITPSQFIITQPEDQVVPEGQTATFSVVAAGTGPLSYQWQRWNGVVWEDIPGATGASYTTPAATLADDGARFRCVVTNAVGSATSDEATLTVVEVGVRVTAGQQVLYTFGEGGGTTINDVCGVGTPLDLTVEDEGAVSWLPGGGLAINSSTIVASAGAATKVINAAKATDEISLEAWVKPANTTQDGPARIVTLSADLFSRNFTLGQGLWGDQPSDVYDVRLRTTTADDNGRPSLSTPAGSLATELSHVVYTRDASGVARIYVNGVERASGVVGGDFSNWDDSFRLGLANELTGERSWLGEYHLVAIFDRALDQAEVVQNFAAGPIVVPVAPSIMTQPEDQTVTEGQTATFSVVAAGSEPLSYQWQRWNGGAWEDIPGAVSATYTTPATTLADDGAGFRCVVANAVGSATSGEATLTVVEINDPPVAEFVGAPLSGVAPLAVDFTDQSAGDITSYSWDFGDSETSTDQNPSHSYTDPGLYTVSLTVTGPGGSDTETKTDYIEVTAPQPGTATSSAVPSDATPSIGDQIEVAISIDVSNVNPPDEQLGSFTGSLDWDPAVLAYDSNSGILAGFTGVVTVSSGHIDFNGAKPSGATGNITVLEITFDVVGAGGTDLDLEYSAMAAALTFNDLLPILTVTDGNVQVGPAQYTLTMAVDPVGSGTTTPSVGDHDYDSGTVVNISATPAAGYRFVNWTGDVADPNSATTTVTMSGDETVTANFSQIIPDIAIDKTPDTQMVVSGSDVTFTITVTNTGEVTLDVTVTDILASDCNADLGSLEARDSASYTCTRANVKADFTNSATATGTPPVGDVVTDTDTATVHVEPAPAPPGSTIYLPLIWRD